MGERCTYCPNPATTDDHVPPKGLFSEPLPGPSSLITVPACESCNPGSSKDDEYFKVYLTMNRRLDHPEVEAVRRSSLRALSNPGARGFLFAFLKTVQAEQIRSPAGLYLPGKVVTYTANVPRLCRVARRVTLGLRYSVTGRRAESGEQVTTYLLNALTSEEVRLKLFRDARDLQRFGNRGTAARDVLSYAWWDSYTNAPGVSAWLLLFYEKIPFLTYVLSASSPPISHNAASGEA